MFLRLAERCGLQASRAEIVADRHGVRALAVARFDRSELGGAVIRHPQEDGTQVLGIYPGEKYDPDARTVVSALSGVCSAPKVAARDLLHQMIYSYAIGNNDLHAKNLSVKQDPTTGLWRPTPVYDVLHTWPYEGDHRFHPAIRAKLSDSVSRPHWLQLGDDIGVPRRATERLITTVDDVISQWLETLDSHALPMPEKWIRDVRRRIGRRLRDLRP
jgi:serine/threonine-protein kinase HipA